MSRLARRIGTKITCIGQQYRLEAAEREAVIALNGAFGNDDWIPIEVKTDAKGIDADGVPCDWVVEVIAVGRIRTTRVEVSS